MKDQLSTENEVLERCYNDSMPSGRCTLPRGHIGFCVSPAEAEIDRLREVIFKARAELAADHKITAAHILELAL